MTGSNASLLKGERASKLTGRHVSVELFPFSYAEFVAFTRKRKGRKSVEEYLEVGGFPRYVETREESHLTELFDDIVYRDVVVRHGVREVSAVERLAAYLCENPGCRFSARRHAPVLAVQACVELTTGDLDRELGGVRAAMSRFGLKEGWIVTLSQTDAYKVPEGTVRVVPFHGFEP